MSYKFFSHKATLQSQVSVRPSAKPLSLLESCLSAKSQSIGHYANQLSAISSFFVPLFARDFFPLDLNLNQRPTSPSHVQHWEEAAVDATQVDHTQQPGFSPGPENHHFSLPLTKQIHSIKSINIFLNKQF